MVPELGWSRSIMEVIDQHVREIKSWEEYLSEGMIARENSDTGKWTLGDLAGGITTDYGEDSIGKYAYAISVEKKTLMGYRTVASKFAPEIRERYRKLSFSHFKAVASLEKPEAWLEKADTEELSVESMTHKINEEFKVIKPAELDDDPPKVYRCPECNLWRLKDTSTFEICKGHYVIEEGEIQYK
jgi:hypothetical protein